MSIQRVSNVNIKYYQMPEAVKNYIILWNKQKLLSNFTFVVKTYNSLINVAS